MDDLITYLALLFWRTVAVGLLSVWLLVVTWSLLWASIPGPYLRARLLARMVAAGAVVTLLHFVGLW